MKDSRKKCSKRKISVNMGKHRVEFNNSEAIGPNKHVLRVLHVRCIAKGKNQQLGQLTEITVPLRRKCSLRRKKKINL